MSNHAIVKEDLYTPFLRKYLSNDADSILFLLAFGIYIHAVDDIVDDEIPQEEDEIEFMLKTFLYAEAVYTNLFYLKHIDKLRPVVKLISNAYMDSVKMERSKERWKQKVADVLRFSGNEMIIAVIAIVCGEDIMRKASMELREISYLTSYDNSGNPI